MDPGPPKVIERLIALCIPPACREYVLGDLRERYESPQQYLGEALRTVPYVIFSRVRRTSRPRLVLAEAAVLYGSFLAAACWLGGLEYAGSDGALLGLAIPAAAALVALVLRDAWCNADPASVDAGVRAVTVAFLSQAILVAVDATLVLPVPVLCGGAMLSLIGISILRLVFLSGSSRSAEPVPAGTPAEEIGRKLEKLRQERRMKNVTFLIAGCFIVALGYAAVLDDTLTDRIAAAIIFAAAACVLFESYRRGRAAAVPDDTSMESYRRCLERQRDAARTMWAWYALPMLVALLAFALRLAVAHSAGSRVGPFVMLAVLWSLMLVRLSRRKAAELQREIDGLDNRH